MFNGPARAARRGATGEVGYFALWVDDVDRAADFYTAVLGWRLTPEGPRRRVIGAPYRIEIVALDEMRAQAWPRRTAPTGFCALHVEDLAAAAERIRYAGGTVGAGHPGTLDCTDDQGLAFAVYADAPPEPNDALAYLTVEVPSIEAATRFFETVFDWSFRAGSHDHGRQVDGPTPMTGFAGGATEPAIVPMFAVHDVAAAVERVRAAGGTAGNPRRYPYGLTSDCADDQGLRFYLGELD
jgi:predicted enzyme related to lactoylglutathione lyase